MKIFAICTLLTLAVSSSKQECSLQISIRTTYVYSICEFNCRNTNPENFIYDFLKPILTSNVPDRNKRMILQITDSNFTNINYFNFFIPLENIELTEFGLTNSSVHFIEDRAFEHFSSLTDLALSNNKLRNLSFVNTLPASLETLYLDGNEFEIVTNVFTHLRSLSYLDLSKCKISRIEPYSFSTFRKDVFVTVRKNKLSSFDISFSDGVILTLDLSYNNIEYIRSESKGIYFKCLNASHNKIKHISDISCQDCGYNYYRSIIHSIDLSFNDLQNFSFLNFFTAIKTENLSLSNSNIDDDNFNFEVLKFVKNTVDLSYNKLKNIKPSMLGYELELNNLLLRNSSVENIETKAFENYNLNILDLSFNLVSELKNYTFEGSSMGILNISHCRIQKIDLHAFFGLSLRSTLDLSHNKLTYLSKDKFYNLNSVVKIDLSYNFLKKLDNNLFINCVNLETLILSNSKIEVIRMFTFAGLRFLSEVNLENNLISNIQFQINDGLDEINLKNNSLSNIDFLFLRNLSASVVDLSNSNIRRLKNGSIRFISVVQEMRLSQSKIYTIEPNAFLGLANLRILDLSSNLIEVIHSGTFIPLKKLEILHLFGNKIVSFSSSGFAFGNQLQTLSLSFSNISLTSNTFIALNALKLLEISNSSILLLDKNCFKGLIYLETVLLSQVEIKEILSGAFNGLHSLQNVNFKVIYESIDVVRAGAFDSLPSFVELDLSSLNLKELEGRAFVGLPKLRKLLLNNNKLRRVVNNTFSELDSLEILNLSRNLITTLEPKAFAGLINLKELFLTDNNLTRLALGTFQEFPNLKNLVLQRNYINKLLTGTFTNLKLLDHLDLSYNNITKLKMQNFMSLTKLKTLDFTGNHLIQMSHLEMIKSLRQLQYVGLNDNKWKCDNLSTMLTAFQNNSISWVSEKGATYDEENIDGIKCYNICKFFYCVDEQDNLD